MADEPAAAAESDDARLLDLVRAGDGQAFGLLYQRHSESARRLARHLVSPAEVDQVVAETFTRILDVLRRAGGPADAFRCYLLIAVRRVCDDRFRGLGGPAVRNDLSWPDPGWPFLDPATMPGHDDALIVRAFLAQPERWSALLWHTEIEQESATEVAPLFGLSLNGVAALERRAREGVRQAYLEMYITRIMRPGCLPVAERLGAFLRYALAESEAGEVGAHIGGCGQCRTVCSELTDVDATLRSRVAPVFLGSSAAAYLPAGFDIAVSMPPIAESSGPPWAHARDVPATAVTGTGLALTPAPPDEPAQPRAGGGLAGLLRQPRWLASVGGVALLAIATAAFALTINGHKGAVASHDRKPAAGLQTSPGLAGLGASASPTGRLAPRPPRKSPSPHPSAARPSARSSPSPPQPSPSPSSTASSSAAALTASINVYGFGDNPFVVFQVTDTGSASTGDLTATITLPPGSSLSSQDDHGRHGWSCQATSSGASCQHDPISAGIPAFGTIQVQLSGTAACGQPVQLAATSGSASAGAQSPEDIQCSSGN